MKTGSAAPVDVTKELTFGEFTALLRPYFWPKQTWDRIRAISCFSFLGISKVFDTLCRTADFESHSRLLQACGILAPIFLGQAVDIIKDGERLPWELLSVWAALVCSSSCNSLVLCPRSS